MSRIINMLNVFHDIKYDVTKNKVLRNFPIFTFCYYPPDDDSCLCSTDLVYAFVLLCANDDVHLNVRAKST